MPVAPQLLLHGCLHGGVSVTQYTDTDASDQIEIGLVVNVIQITPFCPVYFQRQGSRRSLGEVSQKERAEWKGHGVKKSNS
jgi:hypothetical protein